MLGLCLLCLPSLFVCFQYVCPLLLFLETQRKPIPRHVHIQRPSLQVRVFGLKGLSPTWGINWRLGGVFKWLVSIFMQAFRDWLLIGLHEFWLHLFDLFPLSWLWMWIHIQAFFNLKIHTHSWLLHKTLKLKRKVVLTRALNKIWNTWVLGLVLPCTSSVSLGSSFLSRPGFLTGQGGMVLTTAKVPWSSASLSGDPWHSVNGDEGTVLKVGSQAQSFSFSCPLAEISVCGWLLPRLVSGMVCSLPKNSFQKIKWVHGHFS